MDDIADSQTGARDTDHWTRTLLRTVAGRADLQVRLYTRSAVPAFGTRSYYDEVCARIESLVDEGVLEGWEREIWGGHLDPAAVSRADSDTARDTSNGSTAADVRAWAERHGLASPFEERKRQSTVLDETDRVLVPPHVLVAVEDDRSLLGVAPCGDGEQTTTVMDLLTLLTDAETSRENRRTATA